MAATLADICYGDTSRNFDDQDTYEEVDIVEDQQATAYSNLNITQPSEKIERTKTCKTEETPVNRKAVTLRKDPEGQTLSLREKRIIFAVLGVFGVLLLATSVTSGVILSKALSRTENFEDSSVDGQWTDWLEWSSCSVTCGVGQKRRQRLCLNPRPQNGGINCSGSNVYETTCHATSCPLNVSWSTWGVWSGCSVTCGSGQRIRKRLCFNPSRFGIGAMCPGTSSESMSCSAMACPVNGDWGPWGKWGKCYTIGDGIGISYRTRSCSNPSPLSSGLFCAGEPTQYQSCSVVSVIQVRLSGGESSSSGRVEIYYNSQWCTVCDDSWDDNDARVVCRMMGLSGGIARTDSNYGRGNGTILLDDVYCNGNEASILDCRHNGFGFHNCGHSEDAGVDCS